MDIMIINEYAGNPKYGMSYRHYYLAKEWQKLGHNVSIISGSYSHFYQKQPTVKKMFTIEYINGIKYIWVKVLSYRSSHDKRRVIKWFQFALKILFINEKNFKKPDVIICSPTPTFAGFSSVFLKRRFKAKYIFEVRDIWPKTLIELGGYSKYNLLVLIMKLAEKFSLLNADEIVSNLSNYNEHLKELNIKKVPNYIPNGILINENQEYEELNSEVKCLIPTDSFIIGYTGTIGHANAMEYLVDAMSLLKDQTKIKCIIVGKGKNLKKIKQRAKDLDNIIFIPPINKNQIPSMLDYFDVCYIGLHNKSIFNYGISPNKLYDYMLSGTPVIQAINTKNDIVQKSGCGFSIDAEDSQMISKKILELFNMPKKKRNEMGTQGIDFVRKYHDYEYLAKKYAKLF